MSALRLNYTIVIVFICVLIFYTCKHIEIRKQSSEPFINFKELHNEPLLHYKLLYTAQPVIQLVQAPESTLSSMKKFMKQRMLLKHTTETSSNAIVWNLTDVVSYVPSQNSAVITVCDSGKHALFVANKTRNPISQLRNCKNKIIGVAGPVEEQLAKIILQTYGIRNYENTFVQMPTASMSDALFVDNNIDVALYYITKDSVYMKDLADNQIRFVEYDDVDLHKVKIWLPYCRKSKVTVPIDKRNPNKAAAESLQTYALEMDTIITGDPMVDHPYLTDIVDFMQSWSKNNYYTQHFPFHPHTMHMLRQFNATIAAKMKSHLLEGFVAEPVALRDGDRDDEVITKVNTNLDGIYHYDGKTDTSVFISTGLLRINGISIRRHDRVLLTNQVNANENGYYYVTTVNPVKTILMSRLPIKESALSGTRLFNGDKLIVMKAANTVMLGTISKGTLKTEPLRDTNAISDGVCFENKMYITKAACESTNDLFGKPKKPYTWDAPCKYDDECPFYKLGSANGKCNQGFCEMPLGVVRRGYRKYDASASKPLCHGCKDPEACCGLSNTPKYAFGS